MSKLNFRGVPNGGVAELREYLVYLVTELTYLLGNIDTDNLSPELKDILTRRNADG